MSNNVATTWTRDHSKLLLAMALSPAEVGKRIKQAREQQGWTQLDFALEAHVSPSSVARWEAGKLPPVRELFRIAELLEVEVDQLVEPAPSQSDGLPAEVAAAVQQGFAEIRAMLEQLDADVQALARRLPAEAKPKRRRAVS